MSLNPLGAAFLALAVLFLSLWIQTEKAFKSLLEKTEKPQQVVASAPLGPKTPDLSVPKDSLPKIDPVEEALRTALRLDGDSTSLAEMVTLAEDDRGLIVRLIASRFYKEGQLDVEADLQPLLRAVARVLRTTERKIRIVGHASRAEKSKIGTKNLLAWDLSVLRSSWVARFFSETENIDPARIEAQGRGDQEPLERSNPLWQEGMDRRIEIIILRE